MVPETVAVEVGYCREAHAESGLPLGERVPSVTVNKPQQSVASRPVMPFRRARLSVLATVLALGALLATVAPALAAAG